MSGAGARGCCGKHSPPHRTAEAGVLCHCTCGLVPWTVTAAGSVALAPNPIARETAYAPRTTRFRRCILQ